MPKRDMLAAFAAAGVPVNYCPNYYNTVRVAHYRSRMTLYRGIDKSRHRQKLPCSSMEKMLRTMQRYIKAIPVAVCIGE